MMRSALILASIFLAPVIATAGTCEAPTPLVSNTNVTGATTCGGPVGINMGGTVYPHPSNVFSFTKGAGATSINITGTDREMSLVTACDSAPPNSQGPGPIAGGFNGGPNMDISGLTNGTTYFLVVSTDPSIPTATPPVCGTFNLTVGTLPVSLQKFEVK